MYQLLSTKDSNCSRQLSINCYLLKIAIVQLSGTIIYQVLSAEDNNLSRSIMYQVLSTEDSNCVDQVLSTEDSNCPAV